LPDADITDLLATVHGGQDLPYAVKPLEIVGINPVSGTKYWGTKPYWSHWQVGDGPLHQNLDGGSVNWDDHN
jgi:hypothetical protein